MTNSLSMRKLREAVIDPSVMDKETVQRIFIDSKFRDSEGRAAFASLLRSLDQRETSGNMAALESVTTPGHLLWAMNDPNHPWGIGGKLLERTLPDTRVTLLEQAGHFLMLDAEDRYVDAHLS